MDVVFVIFFVSIIIFTISLLFYRVIKLKTLSNTTTDILTDRLANFYGLSSKGVTQIRGNGLLRLTNQSLYFEMYLPFKKLEIALKDISDVDVTNAHLGKIKIGYKILRIKYMKDQNEDTAAWSVGEVEEWIRQINKLRMEFMNSNN